MSHFFGKLQGNRGEATRRGDKRSGLGVRAASWEGSVKVFLYHNDEENEDWAIVWLEPWHGAGVSTPLYEGPVGRYEPHHMEVLND